MTIAEVFFLVAAGLGAGLIGSLFGLGGGILIVPVLALAMKVPMHSAIATSLLCVIATSSAAASKNIQSGTANVRLGTILEMVTVTGAILGSSIAGLLPGRALMTIFGVAMGIMAIPMARGIVEESVEEVQSDRNVIANGRPFFAFRSRVSEISGSYFDPASGQEVFYQVRRLPMAMGVSSGAGILSGLLGVGGGIVIVPLLSLWCGVPMKAAAATSNLVIGVTAAASAIIYYGRGEVSSLISAAAVIGVFAGSRLGAHLAPRIHAAHLRRAFAALMVVVSAQMLWRGLSS